MDSPTIVDVIENYFGELPGRHVTKAMTRAQFEDLATVVNQFSLSYRPTASGHYYAGGWGSAALGGDDTVDRLARQLLYAPGVVIHDPVSEWFYPYRTAIERLPPISAGQGHKISGDMPTLWRGDGHLGEGWSLERERGEVGRAIAEVGELAPFIRSGAVVAVCQFEVIRRHQAAILSEVRHSTRDPELEALVTDLADAGDPLPRLDNVRGATTTMQGMSAAGLSRAVVEGPTYYLAKTLAVSADVGALYMPPAPSDLRLLRFLMTDAEQALAVADIGLLVAHGLETIDLPFLEGVDASTLIAARLDEEAFEAWQASLRTAVRTVQHAGGTADERRREASDAIKDMLIPAADEVRRAMKRSRVLGAGGKDHGVEFAAGVAGLIAPTLGGGPVTLAAALTLVSSTVARWGLRSIIGDQGSTENAFLAAIYQPARK